MSIVSEIDDIEETATLWVMRIDGGALPEEQQRELDAWLEADTRHLGAFVRAQAVWVDLDRVAALAAGRAPAKARTEPWRWQRAAAIAAVTLGLLAALAVVNNRYLAGRESTQVGEVRRLTLEDGSALALNTASVLQVKFDEDMRRVVLREGEASFQVTHDEQRPFIVQAGNVSVRAVGTAFSVRMRPSERRSHRDRRRGGSDAQRCDGARRGGKGRAQPGSRGRNSRATDHGRGVERARGAATLVLAGRAAGVPGRSARHAVAEVNRYSPLPVVIDDPVLGSKSFVGVFRVGDTRAFAQAAATAFDAQLHEENGALHLRD